MMFILPIATPLSSADADAAAGAAIGRRCGRRPEREARGVGKDALLPEGGRQGQVWEALHLSG